MRICFGCAVQIYVGATGSVGLTCNQIHVNLLAFLRNGSFKSSEELFVSGVVEVGYGKVNVKVCNHSRSAFRKGDLGQSVRRNVYVVYKEVVVDSVTQNAETNSGGIEVGAGVFVVTDREYV